MISLRSRYVFFPIFVTFILLLTFFFRGSVLPSSHPPEPPPAEEKHPIYKSPKPSQSPLPPIPEYFPLAAKAKSPADLPPIPSWNKPPAPHVLEKTRLYIGFTRYWPLLQQVVVSYIAAGWPPEDIYVIENTGTFDSNRRGLLSPPNPFYLDYHRLTKIFGVNVLTTPSLQTFAQLQNFYLSEAINHDLPYYFWSHMDVVAQTHEDATPYRSLYQIAVDVIRESEAPGYGVDEETGEKKDWAIRFFSYDWLALVKTASYVKIGGWDSMIGYYGTDCDMHNRIAMNNLTTPIADAGQIFDVGRSMDDLERLFRRKKKGQIIEDTTSPEEPKDKPAKRDGIVQSGQQIEEALIPRKVEASSSPKSSGSAAVDKDDENPSGFTGSGERISFAHPSSSHSSSSAESPSGANADYLSNTEEDTLNSPLWRKLQEDLEAMAEEKRSDEYRNSWQLRQRGGEGEPFYYDADGWEKALQMTIDTGMKIMEEKWGHRGCDLREAGLKEGDQWKVEHDF